MHILVNGTKHELPRFQKTVSHGDVIRLAGFFSPATSVTYRLPGGAGGILASGDRVAAVDGSVFNAADTSRA